MLRSACIASLVITTMLSFCQISHAQMFFEADWLFFDRNNDASGNIVTGPESAGMSNANFGVTSGYRLTFGGTVGALEVDASFSQFDTWKDFSQGTFNNIIIFDDTAGNPFVDPGMNANSLATFTSLYRAAMYVSPMMGGEDESLESERFTIPGNLPMGVDGPFPSYEAFNRANLREFEVNIGTPRNSRLWRFSFGYRHIKFDERNGFALNGLFDAIDVNDGNPFDNGPDDDPNNGLSHQALLAAGLTHLGGTTGFAAVFHPADPMDAIAPTLITYQVLGFTDNELNGAQFTGMLTLFDGTWITIEGIGKAGIYRNNMSGFVQENVVGSGNNDAVYQRTFRGSRTAPAFAGNLGIRGIISLTDYINLVAGYEALFISGLALGADQTNGLSEDVFGNVNYKVRNRGNLIAHGGTLGLEVTW